MSDDLDAGEPGEAPEPKRRDRKNSLHDAIAENLPPLANVDGPAALVRWVVVAEVALAGDQVGLLHLSGNAAGGDVRSWDQAGMLSKITVRELMLGSG